MLKLSKYAHIFDDKNHPHIALHHSVKLSTIFLERECLEILNQLKTGLDDILLSTEQKEFIDELVKMKFVVDFSANENLPVDFIPCLKPDLSVMYLILTDRCNLGCKYCFVEAGFPADYKCNDMSWDVAKKAIDLFNTQRNKNVPGRIWFYGGEPLMNTKLLFECLDYLGKEYPEIEPIMVTNGTLITQDLADRLAEYSNLQIAVSLDGPGNVHDIMRVDKLGHGSYVKTRQGIRNLKSAGINFGISCTIAEHNVDQVETVARWANEEVGSNSIGINFLVDTPKMFIDEEYMRKANEGLIDFFKNSRNKENVFESRMLRKVTAFITGEPRWHDCAACGSQIVISPLGEIGICHEGLGERRTFVGSIHKEFDYYNNDQVKEWARRSPATMPECQDCEALGICGGGCPYGAMLRYGSMWDVDKRFCVHSKGALNWLIWDLYDQMTKGATP